MKPIDNWLNSLTWQVSFHSRSIGRRRHDGEMDWSRFDRSPSGRLFAMRRHLKAMLYRTGLSAKVPVSMDWLRDHAADLWETRQWLIDDVSRMLFDASLVLRATSHRHFYFPRIDFHDLVKVTTRKPFHAENLPEDYLGTPLEVFDIEFHGTALELICTEPQIVGLNSYRQYLIERNGLHVAPRSDEVVLDCGACIGDFSVLFAAMVGAGGQVHAFDPIPLHNRYCALQASLNPSLAEALRFNTLAVGNRSFTANGTRNDLDHIDPGQIKIEAFDCTTLDDYASRQLTRIDYIKMDIEGAELDAIEGAASIIDRHHPRLAISVYHKPEDLWEIPRKLKSLNPNYAFMFGHHSPVHWESVLYAMHVK